MKLTEEESELILFKNIEFLRNWNPDTQTALDLKYAYMKAENLAIKLRNDEILNEVTEYTRFYEKPFDHHDPEPCHEKDIAELIDSDNRIIANDYKGFCLLLLDVDEWGNSTNNMYAIRSIGDVWTYLEEKVYRDHMERD